jgi:hypothetical protein
MVKHRARVTGQNAGNELNPVKGGMLRNATGAVFSRPMCAVPHQRAASSAAGKVSEGTAHLCVVEGVGGAQRIINGQLHGRQGRQDVSNPTFATFGRCGETGQGAKGRGHNPSSMAGRGDAICHNKCKGAFAFESVSQVPVRLDGL